MSLSFSVRISNLKRPQLWQSRRRVAIDLQQETSNSLWRWRLGAEVEGIVPRQFSQSTRPPDPSSARLNTKGYFDKQSQQRREHIANLKKKTQCIECHQFGHWAGDDVCPKRAGKRSSIPQQTGRSSSQNTHRNYLAVTEHPMMEMEQRSKSILSLIQTCRAART